MAAKGLIKEIVIKFMFFTLQQHCGELHTCSNVPMAKVDGVLNVVSAWTLTSGDDLRTMQTGRAQDYVYGVAVGLMILLLWVRWALA